MGFAAPFTSGNVGDLSQALTSVNLGSTNIAATAADIVSAAIVKTCITIVLLNASDTLMWVSNDGGAAVVGDIPLPPAVGNNYGCVTLSRLTGTLAPNAISIIHGGSGNKVLYGTYWTGTG